MSTSLSNCAPRVAASVAATNQLSASATVSSSGAVATTAASVAAAAAVGANTGFLDLVLCKLVAPFHLVDDPRLLECGSSACFKCIWAAKDNERNLKCSYCGGVHKIPADANKLIVNKNVLKFLKTNAASATATGVNTTTFTQSNMFPSLATARK